MPGMLDIVWFYLAFPFVGRERGLGRFAVPGVHSPDSLKTKGIVMTQTTQCPSSLKALQAHGNLGHGRPDEVWSEYSISYTTSLAPRSRHFDASTGGQHGCP